MAPPIPVPLPILKELQKGQIPLNPAGVPTGEIGFQFPPFTNEPGPAPAGYVYQSRAAFDWLSPIEQFIGPAVNAKGKLVRGRHGPPVSGRVRFTGPAVTHTLTALPGTKSLGFWQSGAGLTLAGVLSIPIVGPVVKAVTGLVMETAQAVESALAGTISGGTSEASLVGASGADVLEPATVSAAPATSPSVAEAAINLGAEPYEAYLPYSEQGALAQAATRSALPVWQSLATDPLATVKDFWDAGKDILYKTSTAALGASAVDNLLSGAQSLTSDVFNTIGGGASPGGPPPPAGLFPTPPGVPTAPVSFAGGTGGGGFYNYTATSPANSSLTPWMIGLALLGILVTIYFAKR